MGNTVVQKPSEYTTLCALAFLEVWNEVLPEGVLVPVTGSGDVGDALVRDRRIGKVMFTGSVKTGMKVVQASAGNLSRLTLELGGNDAGIVLPDADPSKIAEGVFWSAFINNGQTCAALKRLYVPDAIYNQVIDSLAAFTATMPTGPGLDESNALGPLQNQMQWNVVNRLVEDAHRRHRQRRAPGSGGAVRPGAADHPLHRRGAGDRVGERRGRRPRRLGLVGRPGPGEGDRRTARGRNGLDQRPRRHPPDDPVRRREALRLRP